jgi:hypothetical protein
VEASKGIGAVAPPNAPKNLIAPSVKSAAPPTGAPSIGRVSLPQKTDSRKQPETPSKTERFVDKLASGAKGVKGALSAAEKIATGETASALSRGVGKVADMVGGSRLGDGAVRGVYKVTDEVQKQLHKVDAVAESSGLKKVVETGAFKKVAQGAEGLVIATGVIKSYQEAQSRGDSRAASGFTALGDAVIDKTGFGAGIDKIAGGLQAGVEMISPRAGAYTKTYISDNTPSKMAKNIVHAAIDLTDHAIRGDASTVARNMEKGDYSAGVQGYALAGAATYKVITGDRNGLNRLSDEASQGKLGGAPQAGDKLGDWMGKQFPIPQWVLHQL